MSKDQSSYRQIMKATSLFGGVQVFNIIVNIVRTKFVAILLGPVGIGISGLLTSTISLISSLTNFGLGTSAVRNISSAFASGDETRVAQLVVVVKRLVWITGALGALIMLIFSSFLSELTFGNHQYTYAFAWISISLLINQISIGQNVVLRGMRKLKYLAQASMFGSILGLFTTVPLFYYYELDGIVPGIIVTSISTLLLTWYYSNKVKVLKSQVSRKRTLLEGKDMLKMGFMISLSGLIAQGGSYVVRIFISNTGGVDQVGLYTAGFAIINSYVGMIFAAMSTDYYPRLSSVSNDNDESRLIITQQAEIALLILAPVILIFLVFINWVVILLYSSKFIEVSDMILWAILGIFFKAVSWSIAFIFLAKGASKLFFWNELITNIYILGFNIIGYYFWGLTGLGVSFLVGYMLYVFQVYFITNRMYNFHFTRGFYKIFISQLTLASCCLGVVKYFDSPYSFLFGGIFIGLSSYLSFKELDNRLGLKAILKNLKDKFL
tara:strand:+ start:3813 stop:5297 length:1485 start_codon:yes stop_codon:yes gene_type:complete